MQEHQLRVVEERKELGIKISALYSFICCDDKYSTDLTEDDKNYLLRQGEVMVEYLRILDLRIKSFKP